MDITFYAKSSADGKQISVRQHLSEVATQAEEFASSFGASKAARLAGLFHDFGKYSEAFQKVLTGERQRIDHAVCGAAFLYQYSANEALNPVVEAVNGHHDGLRECDIIDTDLENIYEGEDCEVNDGKTPALLGEQQYESAFDRFQRDFPEVRIPEELDTLPEEDFSFADDLNVENMLYTRMLFSCLVDADYSVSKRESQTDDAEEITLSDLDADQALERLRGVREGIRAKSAAGKDINRIRDQLYEQCGQIGRSAPAGLFTLTAPTGTGKTLALLHFALQQCKVQGKRRVILVLPFLTLADQSEDRYREIFGWDLLVDHSQSESGRKARGDERKDACRAAPCSPEQEEAEEAFRRECAARWAAPVIITTTVNFFESLFSGRPQTCRKLHSVADSVILFDEAQSLPPEVTACTLKAVNELCRRYRCTMVFSTATQPDFAQIPGLTWKPTEILPDSGPLSPDALYPALRRVRTEWRISARTQLEDLAAEMAAQSSVCAIVNLRRHARTLYRALKDALPGDCDSLFFLTTDLCPAHRREVVRTIRERLAAGRPCRVVATQCIEAGVDLDFDAMYRALAPLEAIIQAAGRCNRNGRLPAGRLVVFVPEDDEGKSLYPGDWYGNAAGIVYEMSRRRTVDIDDPAHIQAYYKSLFPLTRDKHALTRALEERDFQAVEKEYRLIDNRGAQVIVPYPMKVKRENAEVNLFDWIAEQARNSGLTNGLLRDAAPITVSTFLDAARLEQYAEPLYYLDRRTRTQVRSGNVWILRTQYRSGDKALYQPDMGLQFEDAEKSDYLI